MDHWNLPTLQATLYSFASILFSSAAHICHNSNTSTLYLMKPLTVLLPYSLPALPFFSLLNKAASSFYSHARCGLQIFGYVTIILLLLTIVRLLGYAHCVYGKSPYKSVNLSLLQIAWKATSSRDLCGREHIYGQSSCGSNTKRSFTECFYWYSHPSLLNSLSLRRHAHNMAEALYSLSPSLLETPPFGAVYYLPCIHISPASYLQTLDADNELFC